MFNQRLRYTDNAVLSRSTFNHIYARNKCNLENTAFVRSQTSDVSLSLIFIIAFK